MANERSAGETVIRIFGSVGVHGPDGPVSIGGPQQRRLLALLTLRSGSLAGIDWLAEHLWADADRPETPAPALRTYMSRLRHALPADAQEWLRTEPGGYMLDAPAAAIEHLRFAALRSRAAEDRERGDPLAAMRRLDDALGLWRGEPFCELEDSEAARTIIEQLRVDRLETQEERWECALALGRHTQITGELAVFTTEHTLRDRGVRQYALALHRSGRTAEALRVIAHHRSQLSSESGLDPSPAMIQLEQAILSADASLEVEKVGRPLRGYRLLDQIGSGAFSIVWRGMQPSVGREVAIKQIREELASQPEFIRRFEAEAHLIARIEHPHVVPLIDFWRDPDSAYLVMRYLRGDSLERLLDDGPMDLGRVVTLGRQIGDALSAAHARGIVHRDVKTANILFDESGRNAFLSDFGIALEASESTGPAAAFSTGSPAYSAPEQIRQEPLGPRTDVFSLGVVLFECLTGSLPFADTSSATELVERQLHSDFPSVSELRPDIPMQVCAAIAKATAKSPADRFETAAEFVAALGSPDGDHAAPSSSPPLEATFRQVTGAANPYLGLRAFDEADSGTFFGRERLVSALVARLQGTGLASRCVGVVGPSGSGKSSVVRAGLSPAVRRGDIAGSENWLSTTMIPGSDPFEALEAALLRIAVNPPASMLEQMRTGPRGILRSVRRCLNDDTDRVFLVIDQFEEIFTAGDEERAFEFLSALAVAVEDPKSPLRLAFTLRADFYDRPLAHPTFARVLDAGVVNVTPLSADELERAMVEPARHVGVEFEPGLVALIVAECIGQPAPLPLLQYALSEQFDRRDGATLTIKSYQDMGRLAGALAMRAESIHDRADPDQRAAIRRSFGRMTSAGGDAGDVRRRVPVSDLGTDEATRWVLEQFGTARLLTFDRDHATREPTVEVAHEALLREWPRLVGWLRDDAEVLRAVDAVTRAARSWEDAGRCDADLLRSDRLDAAKAAALQAPDRFRAVDLEFIDRSHDLATAERVRERGRVRRLRRLVGLSVAALVIATLAAGIAFAQRDQAQDATERAELATLVSDSAAQAADDPELAVLLALEAHRRSPGDATEQAVLNSLGSTSIPNRLSSLPLGFEENPQCGSWAASGELLDLSMLDGLLASRDGLTGQVTTHGEPPAPCVQWDLDPITGYRWAGIPDGTAMWAGPAGGGWEVEWEFDEPRFKVSDFIGSRRMLFVSSPTDDPQVYLTDLVNGQDVGATIVGGKLFLAARSSSDGSRIAVGFGTPGGESGDGVTVVLDGETARELHRIETPLPFTGFEFDLENNELVAAGVDGSLATIDLSTGQIVASVDTRAAVNISDIGLRPDGLVLVTSAGHIETVDRRRGPVGDVIELRNALQALVRPDGRVTTFTSEERLEIVDLAGTALVQQSHEVDPFAFVGLGPGWASAVLWPVEDATIIDLETGTTTTQPLMNPDGTRSAPRLVVVDDAGLWAIDLDGLSRWVDGELQSTLDLGEPTIWFWLHGDSMALVSEGPSGAFTAHLVRLDVEAGPQVEFSVPSPGFALVSPGIDDRLHIVDTDGVIHTFDTDGIEIATIDTGLIDPSAIAVDEVTGRLAIAAGPGGATIVDPITGVSDTVPTTASLITLGFVRNGELLSLTSADGNVRIWDVDTNNSPSLVWNGTGSTESTPPWYDEETGSMWVASSGKILQIPLEAEQWVARACEIVGRDLTQDEWDRFVPGDDPLQPACAP